MDKIVLFITCSSLKEAEDIAELLVKKRLVACANLVDGIKSIFFWKEKLESEVETMLICKSMASLIDQITDEVVKVHSYEVPEVLALPVVGGSKKYLKWIEQSVVGCD